MIGWLGIKNIPDKLADNLRIDLEVENKSLRDFLMENLDLCQQPQGPGQAIPQLEAKLRKFSSNIDMLEKLPYCQLFLSYAYIKLADYYRATKYAEAAIDGFDQLNHVWNRSIARWICGLIYEKNGDLDDAERVFNAAARLMTQEMEDHKRRSRYAMAEKCAIVLEKIHADARPQERSSPAPLLPGSSIASEPGPGDLGTGSSGENETELFQNLLRKVGGDVPTAERLIEKECKRAPRASRVECIRMAIARWERDNQ